MCVNKFVVEYTSWRASEVSESQVCSIENRGYIYYSASEAKLTNRRENFKISEIEILK